MYRTIYHFNKLYYLFLFNLSINFINLLFQSVHKNLKDIFFKMTNWLYREQPPENPNYHNQKELYHITDDEYKKMYQPQKFTKFDIFIQIVMFFVSFGWVRLILCILLNVVYVILMIPFVLSHKCKKIQRKLLGCAIFISRIYVRTLCMTFGVVWVKMNGKVSKENRNFIYNHTTAMDGPLIYSYSPFTMIMTSGVKKVPYYGKIAEGANTCFVDRSSKHGNSEFLISNMKDHSKLPIATAPEGKISSGYALFKFRTGSFLTDEVIQPVVLRYRSYFAYCGAGINWLHDSFLTFAWLSFCCPFTICEMTYLDPIDLGKMKDKTPEEKAIAAELIMANALGVRAGDRTNHELFLKKSQENNGKAKNE